MTLIEAIRSGRPFRRKGAAEWATWSDERCTAIKIMDNGDGYQFMRERDILADDWEIQEPSVTITRTQLLEAYGAAMTVPPWDKHVMDVDFALAVAAKLGLGEAP